MRKIVLVGTCHTFQSPGSSASALFRVFVEKLCKQHEIKAIGEELSEDAIAEKHKSNSVCKEIASKLKISHRYCDPTRDQRRALRIKPENDIAVRGWLEHWTAYKIKAKVAESHSIRERFWLDQLVELKVWPALFICGANHIRSFGDLARQNGFEVIVARRDWTPPAASATAVS